MLRVSFLNAELHHTMYIDFGVRSVNNNEHDLT